MTGIVGIAKEKSEALVWEMLGKIWHRGGSFSAIRSFDGTTLGITCSEHEKEKCYDLFSQASIKDSFRSNREVYATNLDSALLLSRDEVGVAPLYFGNDEEGNLCFASEVKALLVATDDVQILEPGSSLLNGEVINSTSHEPILEDMNDPQQIARLLANGLETAVAKNIPNLPTGAWLSGGLDSSIIAAIANKYIPGIPTFAVGFAGSADLKKARLVAEYLGTSHTEIVVAQKQLLEILAQTIYHLESFDSLLVRSSLLNYIAAKTAREYVNVVFSGEGADELFAGYEYLKSLTQNVVDKELQKLISSLHKTALQRVDRCASAFGLTPIVPFLDREVVSFAKEIPLVYKLRGKTEKWILREAFKDKLPEEILSRKKAKFWDGAGVKDILSDMADERISDHDYLIERNVNNQLTLKSKEEVLYYRIFKDHFGNASNYEWVGRTRQTPKNQ
jgi:asparagine synthase (glutamine-hydrolysing)